ncbi:MAG: hypothetical protein VX086_06695 [Pseudomonadota bacterium]|nr:hypothetical protein [Pseudomonadota bacterium]
MPKIIGGIIRGKTKIVNKSPPPFELAVNALNATPIRLIVKVTRVIHKRKFMTSCLSKPSNRNAKQAVAIIVKQFVTQNEKAFARATISSVVEDKIRRSAVPSLKSL